MGCQLFGRDGANWRLGRQLWGRDSGVWRLAKQAWARNGAAWKLIHTNCDHGMNAHRSSTAEIDAIQSLGCKQARVTMATSGPDEGWDWKLPYYRSHGIEPLIVVHDFANISAAVSFMTTAVATFPGYTWQIGNEYDAYPGHWCEYGNTYADLMNAILTACPYETFVGMGLATTHSSDGTRWLNFLNAYRGNSGPALDAWGFHFYERLTTPWETQAAEAGTALAGFCPLWVTEYGTDIAGDTPQSDHITAVVTNASFYGISQTFYYAYWVGTDNGFGLVQADDTHRPAWAVLQGLLT